MRSQACASLLAVSIMLPACDESPCETHFPSDPELDDRAQILPDAQRAVLSPEQTVVACQAWAECAPNQQLNGQPLAVGRDPVQACIGLLLLASESGGLVLHANESAGFIIDCILSPAGDCTVVRQCSTMNPLYDLCSRGCPRADADVTCNGSVATIVSAEGSVERDCARSGRSCDTSSVSGCSDPLRYSCPRALVGSAIDDCAFDGAWCQGDVRLVCESGTAKVRDCGVFGGTCDASAGCVYPDAPQPGCASLDSLEHGTDSNGEFLCVRGRQVYLQ